MKKFLSVIGISVMLVTLFSFGAGAYNFTDSQEKYWEYFEEALPEGVQSPENEDELLSGVGFDSLVGEIMNALKFGSGSAVSLFALLFGIAVIISASESASLSENPALNRHATAGVTVIAAVLIFGKIGRMCFSVREGIEELSSFFSALIPILTGIMTSGGNLSSAASQSLNMNITLAAVSYIACELLMPLVFTLFSLAMAASMDTGTVGAVAKSVKNLFTWILGICSTVVIASITMQSVVAGAKDSAYLRAARYAASGMIPVVGSTVSSALAALSGGLSYIKTTVGMSAVLVIITLAVSPLINLLLHRLAFSISISFLELAGSTGGVRVYGAFRSALDALLSVYVVTVIVYITELVVFMKCGVSVIV